MPKGQANYYVLSEYGDRYSKAAISCLFTAKCDHVWKAVRMHGKSIHCSDHQGAHNITGAFMKKFNLANALTLSRIIIAPVFAYFFIHSFHAHSPSLYLLVSIGLVCLIELSDAFDGYVARSQNIVSDFGKLLDPMADSLSRQTVFLSFMVCAAHIIPLWVFLIFLYRDAFLSILRIMCAYNGSLTPASFRTLRTLSSGISIRTASSSGVASRPNSCSIWREMRFSLLIVSIMCTGMRMVRAWSAIERVMAWRIHHVA